MNTKKIILNTLCVLAVTVAAQSAYAQSPGDRMVFSEAVRVSFTPSTNKNTSNTTTTRATSNQETTEVDHTTHGREGHMMQTGNAVAHICKCVKNAVGQFCKCIENKAKNLGEKIVKRLPNVNQVYSREFGIMNAGEQILGGKQTNNKTANTKSNSLDSSLERANAEAAKKHAESKK